MRRRLRIWTMNVYFQSDSLPESRESADRHGNSATASASRPSWRQELAWWPALVLAAAMCFLCFVGNAAGAPVGQITEFTAGLQSGVSAPEWMTQGPDGNVWFTDDGNHDIGRVTPTGAITEFPPVNTNSTPTDIAEGPDGNVWFVDQGSGAFRPAIGRITQDGTITLFRGGLQQQPQISSPQGIATGPDGNVWFTDAGTDKKIGRITPSGAIIEFSSPDLVGPGAIAPGADGNMWFIDGQAIGRITPSGSINKFPLPAGTHTLIDIAPGPDGNVWFTDNGYPSNEAIGRITPDGTIAEFPVPAGGQPQYIAPGADGSLWFTQFGTTPAIGRITPDGTITEFSVGLPPGSFPAQIAPGADGSLWFSDPTVGAVGRIGTGMPAASQVAPSITGGGIVNTPQTCQPGAWATWAGVTPLSSLFGFDGYQWLRDGTAIAGQTGQTYTPSNAEVGHQLSCTSTVSYPLPLYVTTAATSAAVTVVLPRHTLTVAVAGAGQGTVTGAGLTCPPTCSGSFTEGTIVPLTAVAQPGSTFTGWSGGGCSTSATCTLTISADTRIQATFAQLPPASTVPPAITGTSTQGQALSTSDGSWLYNVGPLHYQWQRCAPGCADISGATGRSYILTAADLGARIRVLVTATNGAGNTQAASNEVGPVTPPPSQIKATLLTQLAPSGQAAKIATVLKKGGYTFSFKTPSAGRVVIDWYYLPKGAKISKAKPKPVLVATGKASLSKAGRVKLTIKLTASGKKMLKRARSLKLISKGTFTPAGKKAIVASKTITLRR